MSVNTGQPPSTPRIRTGSGVLNSLRRSLSLRGGSPKVPPLAAGVNLQHPEKKYGPWHSILGSGAGGTVRLVKRPKDNRTYAVKEFRPIREGESERHYVNKVTAEFCIGSTLQHINIIKTIDLFRYNQSYFQVLEYAPYDLFSITVAGRMSRDEVYCIFRQIVDGVDYLHNLGLAHRDLKLDNCVMMEDNTIKIIDFGAATVFHSPGKSKIAASGIVGSDPYLAPEVLVSPMCYDPRLADIWSLGVIFLCLYLRRFPWKHPDPAKDEFFRMFMEEHPELIEAPPGAAELATPQFDSTSPAQADSRRSSFYAPSSSKTSTATAAVSAATAATSSSRAGLLPAFDPEVAAGAEHTCERLGSPLSSQSSSFSGANETPVTLPSTAETTRSSLGGDKAMLAHVAFPSYTAKAGYATQTRNRVAQRTFPASCPALAREPRIPQWEGPAAAATGRFTPGPSNTSSPAIATTACSENLPKVKLPDAAQSPDLDREDVTYEATRLLAMQLGKDCFLSQSSPTSPRAVRNTAPQSPAPGQKRSWIGLYGRIPTVSEVEWEMEGFDSPESETDTHAFPDSGAPNVPSGLPQPSTNVPHGLEPAREPAPHGSGLSHGPGSSSPRVALHAPPHTSSGLSDVYANLPPAGSARPRRNTAPARKPPPHSPLVHHSPVRTRNIASPALDPPSPWQGHRMPKDECLHRPDNLLSLCPIEARPALHRMLAISPSLRCTLGDLLRGPKYADALSPLNHLPGELAEEPPEGLVGSSTIPGAPPLSPKVRRKPLVGTEEGDLSRGDPWLTGICTCSSLLLEGRDEKPRHRHHHPERRVVPPEQPALPKRKLGKF